jgi:hypothetical protein
VRERIAQLSSQCEAFVSADRYCVAGVAWVKNPGAIDLSGPLAQALTSLANCPEPTLAQTVIARDIAG